MDLHIRIALGLALCSFIKNDFSRDQGGSVGWASSHKAKGLGFNSQSGHVPGSRAWLGCVQEAAN